MDLKPSHSYSILFVILLLFTLIELNGLNKIVPGDDYTYFYMAKLMSEGELFYRDFFYSHPPLHLFIISLVYKVFGFNTFALRAISFISTIVTTLFLFRIVTKTLGRIQALLAVFLYLTSYLVLLMSTYVYGIELTVMFIVLALYYLFNLSYAKAGLFLGFAGLIGLYSLPITLSVLFYYLIKDRRAFIKLSICFSLAFILVNVIFILIFGKDYYIPVYNYHLLKPKESGNALSVFVKVLKENIFVLLAPILVLLTNQRKRFILYITMIVSYISFLILLNRVFDFYFIILFPFLAIIGSQSIYMLVKSMKSKTALLLVSAFFLLLFLIYSYPLYNRLYNYDFLDFKYKETVNYISADLSDTGTIFGDSLFTPMLALLSNRRISGNIVDTNLLAFQSGVIEPDKVIRLLNSQKPKYIIVREGYGIAKIPQIINFINKDYRLGMRTEDEIWGNILVFKTSSKNSLRSG